MDGYAFVLHLPSGYEMRKAGPLGEIHRLRMGHDGERRRLLVGHYKLFRGKEQRPLSIEETWIRVLYVGFLEQLAFETDCEHQGRSGRWCGR